MKIVISKIIEQLMDINIRTFEFQYKKNDNSSYFIKFKKKTLLVLNKRTFIKNQECPIKQKYINIEEEIFNVNIKHEDFIESAFTYFRTTLLNKYLIIENDKMFIYSINKPYNNIIRTSSSSFIDNNMFLINQFYIFDEIVYTLFDNFRLHTLPVIFTFDHQNKTYTTNQTKLKTEILDKYILMYTEGCRYERCFI